VQNRAVPESLSPADRGSLAAERGPVNMAMGGLMLAQAGPGLSHDAVCRRLQERIHLLPRYRQRLEQPPLGVAHPVWVDDVHFDVAWHVRTATLPAPGGRDELAVFIGRESSRRMDRSRPLWELHLIDGVDGDRVAVLAKMHHALADGMGALGAIMLLVDATPEPTPVEPPAAPWVPEPYDPRRHAAKLAIAPVRRARRWTLDATDRLLELSARSAATELKDATDLITTLARGRSSCPGLPFNGPISANRSWAFTTADLAAIKDAGKRHGGTVNDVVLAAVSGMLAGYLAAAGTSTASLPRDPVALVPVSIRREGDGAPGTAPEGNRISIVFVDLPVGESDPVRRVGLAAARMAAVKDSAQVRAGALMVGAEGFAPPLMSSVLARAAALANPLAPGASPFNLVVTNVPGPQFPLYLNGSKVLAAYPVVPLNPADQRLNVGVFSYDGQVCFGLSADRDLDPPVEIARDALDGALVELLAA